MHLPEVPFPATNETAEPSLPNLLYIGDVPVQATHCGPLQLYRLLQTYPKEKLLIAESPSSQSRPELRLPGVRYIQLPIAHTRLLRSRLSRWYSSWLVLSATHRANSIGRLLDGFQPGAVLSVMEAFSWLTAARYASAHRLPLHLICHDDTPRYTNVIAGVRPRLNAALGAVYRQAASRLCISPYMCDSYAERYHAEGEVLFPVRACDAPFYEAPPARLGEVRPNITVGFAGTMTSRRFVHVFKLLADFLAPLGGRILIFGPFTATEARNCGLDRPNIEMRGFLNTSDELIRRFRQEVDVLFVPMSFEPGDRVNMEICFPSKLTDYTAAGLPLIVNGPAYSSAVRWFRENPGAALIVDTQEPRPLLDAVKNLAENPSYRMRMGANALALGTAAFGYEAAQKTFYSALARGTRETHHGALLKRMG